MKNILIALLVLAATVKTASAQCHITNKTVNGVKLAETDENYIYNRTGNQYHALNLRVASKTSSKGKTYFVTAKYTSSNSADKPKYLQINLADSSQVTLTFKFSKISKLDNKELVTNIYVADLDKTIMDKLSVAQATTAIVSSATKTELAVIEVTDKDMFKQMIGCIK